MGVPVLRSVARVPEAQPRSRGSTRCSPRKTVFELPSAMSSKRKAWFKMNAPLFETSIGASTSL
jgi:hypothetical protein